MTAAQLADVDRFLYHDRRAIVRQQARCHHIVAGTEFFDFICDELRLAVLRSVLCVISREV